MDANSFEFAAEPGTPTIVMTRTFDAPRRFVFDAWTKPEHVAAWWGPKTFTFVACEIDLRPGGAFRWVNRSPDGKEYPFAGTYREVVPPERLVFASHALDGGGESVSTMIFTEQGDRTKLTCTIVCPSVQARDAMIEAGFDAGAAHTWDRLAEFVGATA